ncbi:uncharacterized protein LOC144142271 isoform X2 [Haemaphysalis longicornis]
MDAVSILEDLDNLVVAQDLIILALRDSWQVPKTGRLPVGFRLDSARRVLTTDEKTLTAHRTFLGRNNVATAVFAGCSGFESAKSFRMAAKQVLNGTETLAIVHSKDMIWDLVDWFPTVKTLLLPHNVRLQFDEILRPQPAARQSDLEELLGNTPSMGCTDLYINRNAIIALLAKCPKLRRLQASLHGDLMSGREHPAYDAILSHEALRSCREVRLGSYLERVDNTAFVMEGVSAKGLTCAHEVFPEVTYLEVVSVGDIARKCPRLQKLSLVHCVLVVEGAEAIRSRKHPFPPKALEFLKIHVMCSDKDYLIALLTSCSGQVKQLWLDDRAACRTFIRATMTKTKFSVLERLTLNTDCPASDFMKQDEYPVLLGALPALKHVSTNSYDLRLLFWYFVSPPESIKLAWCQCAICAVEFPRVDKVQKEFWGTLAEHLQFSWC